MSDLAVSPPPIAAAAPLSRGDRRRRELLEATLRVIGEQGIRAVTHRSVATEAGVSLGVTTYHFASKEELIAACLRHVAEDEIAALEAQVAAVDPARLTPAGWADALVAWLGDELTGPARFRLVARYQLQLEAVRRPELRAVYEDWTRAILRLAERILAAAGASDPPLDGAVLLAAVDGLRLNQLARLEPGVGLDGVRPLVARLMARLLA